MRFSLPGLLGFCYLVLLSPQLATQEIQKCGDTKVEYSPFDKGYANRMQVHATPNPTGELSTREKEISPQGTRWRITVPPDTTKPGPWTTHVYVGATGRTDLELVFVDETNGGVELKWLNEKLLYGQVWWGRIYSTDFIFDAEQRVFVYREMAHYGELIEPCKQ